MHDEQPGLRTLAPKPYNSEDDDGMNKLEMLDPHENRGILEPIYPLSYSEVGFWGKTIIPIQKFIMGECWC